MTKQVIEKSIKEKYFKLIENLNLDKEVAERIEKFINTYDGKNVKEFHLMMLSLMQILIQLNDLTIKARVFDQLENIKGEYDEELKKISEQFEEVTSNLIPPVPAVP